MVVSVVRSGSSHRLAGEGPVVDAANRLLGHLEARRYSPATVRAYAFDLLNFDRFLKEQDLNLDDVRPADLFDYLDWQSHVRRRRSPKVVQLARPGEAPATMNRRVASARGLFEHMVTEGTRDDDPVPVARRSSGWRAPAHGLLAHTEEIPTSPGRPATSFHLLRAAGQGHED